MPTHFLILNTRNGDYFLIKYFAARRHNHVAEFSKFLSAADQRNTSAVSLIPLLLSLLSLYLGGPKKNTPDSHTSRIIDSYMHYIAVYSLTYLFVFTCFIFQINQEIKRKIMMELKRIFIIIELIFL